MDHGQAGNSLVVGEVEDQADFIIVGEDDPLGSQGGPTIVSAESLDLSSMDDVDEFTTEPYVNKLDPDMPEPIFKRNAKGAVVFFCPCCNKFFERFSGIVRHIRIHTGGKPFACWVGGCRAAFLEHNRLKYHCTSLHNMSAEVFNAMSKRRFQNLVK